MRIAIIGSGISGLTAAHLLHRQHEITVFEADHRLGGHTHTVTVDAADGPHQVDTGFIVFNEPNYPGLNRLFDLLGVAWRTSEMSFSVRNDAASLEFSGSSVATLFAWKRNALRPRYWSLLREILRFNRLGNAEADSVPAHLTLEEWTRERSFAPFFLDNYLLPLGAAIWSAPRRDMLGYPVRFVLRFLNHHRMMSLRGRPLWRTVVGGSSAYLAPLARGFEDRIRLGTPVRSLAREDDGVRVRTEADEAVFDEVILACHSDQARALLERPTHLEEEILGPMAYQDNEVLLHTDTSVMPRRRNAWASWNYRVQDDTDRPAAVTYDMNRLQGLQSQETYLVSLNHEPGSIADERVIRRLNYAHPKYTVQSEASRERHSELIRHDRLSYCGAYWGNGFHEDGLQSALRVTEAFGERLP